MTTKIAFLHGMPFTEELLARIRGVSPEIELIYHPCRKLAEMRAFLPTDAEIIYTYHADIPLAQAPNLRWVQLNSAGVNHLLGTDIMCSDVVITTTSGIHATPIAEHVIAVTLALFRHLPTYQRSQQARTWAGGIWDTMLAREMRGSTMGIVGYGSIGREVARLAHAFGMRVLATKRQAQQRTDDGYYVSDTGDARGAIPERYYAPHELSEMLTECDAVAVCLPLTAETDKLLGEAELRALKSTAYLINIGRGEVIDEAILIKALQEGWIAGAGLDVFEQEPLPADSPLYDLENVILTPHIAAATPCYQERATELFVQNLRRYLNDEPLLNVVDKTMGY